MSNFLFLKKNNENLFNIISEAEKLFRDEYFEQSIVQIRRFAENICRDLLQDKLIPDETFDSMINRIKDNSFGNMRMKEFTEDLFFLKKHGNISAHSSTANKDGKIALECLERSYEISVFYSNLKYGYNNKLDKSVFSEEILMTGKQSSSNLLKEKYSTELEKTRKNSSMIKQKKISSKNTEPKPKNKSKNNSSIFSNLFNSIAVLLLILLAIAYLYSNIKNMLHI